MFPFHATLRDIQEVIRVAADPLSSAHLAMTCRFEHAARYEYYTRHYSGPRTRASYYILGVAAYGTDVLHMYYRTASYVDRILKGASPADLPVELPTKFEFLVNLKTAQALGLTIPPSVLQQATEVIQ